MVIYFSRYTASNCFSILLSNSFFVELVSVRNNKKVTSIKSFSLNALSTSVFNVPAIAGANNAIISFSVFRLVIDQLISYAVPLQTTLC